MKKCILYCNYYDDGILCIRFLVSVYIAYEVLVFSSYNKELKQRRLHHLSPAQQNIPLHEVSAIIPSSHAVPLYPTNDDLRQCEAGWK